MSALEFGVQAIRSYCEAGLVLLEQPLAFIRGRVSFEILWSQISDVASLDSDAGRTFGVPLQEAGVILPTHVSRRYGSSRMIHTP